MKHIYTLSRIILGIIFIFSGYVKLVDPWGASIKFHEYLEAMGLEAFNGLAFYLSNFLSILELFTGYLLVFHIRIRWGARIAFLLMLFFTPLTLWLAITHKVSDCGCFGDAVKLTDWQTFWKNITLLIPTFVVTLLWKKYPSKISYSKQRLLSRLTILGCIGICYYSYQHLPLLDFRPYAVGKSIPEGMKTPPNSPIDEYETKLIYEKDGKKQAFTEDNYPWQDSTWHFVDSKQTLIKKGYTPPITDFFLEDSKHNNITDDILSMDKCLLLLSYKLEKTNFTEIYRNLELDTIAQNLKKDGIMSYIVTSSSEQQIENIKAFLHPKMPFITADEKVLEAMIRANPGILLLSKGIVMNKWNCNDMPESTKIIKKQYTTNPQTLQKKTKKKELYITLILFLSLTIITLTILKIGKK